MNHATRIVADDGMERVVITVKTKGEKNATRRESTSRHDGRVDRIAEAVASNFHWKNVKVGAFVALIFAAVSFSACAHAPVAPCQNTPQWIVNDAKGKPEAAVYICFGTKNDLQYVARPLTPDQLAALAPKPTAAPAAPSLPAPSAFKSAKKKAAASTSADPCADMTGGDYTACRIDQKAAKAPGDGLKAVK